MFEICRTHNPIPEVHVNFFMTSRLCPAVRYSSSRARDTARALRPGDAVSGYTVQKVSSQSGIHVVLEKKS